MPYFKNFEMCEVVFQNRPILAIRLMLKMQTHHFTSNSLKMKLFYDNINSSKIDIVFISH